MLEVRVTSGKSKSLENTVLLTKAPHKGTASNFDYIVYYVFFRVMPAFHVLSGSSRLVLLHVNAYCL